jgi:dihydroorotate dehydrogenase
VKFFYSASVMRYGFGYKWHDKYEFPNFSRVTRTLTWNDKIGVPFAILKNNDSVWNRVGLHNIGIYGWLENYIPGPNIIVSFAGFDWQIKNMIALFETLEMDIGGIELNFSCPNVKGFNNKEIPKTKYPLYLKLNHLQDPFKYDLNSIKEIRMNSVPGKYFGGWSGKRAQKENWQSIERHNSYGLQVAGCSVTSYDDIKRLEDKGCKSIGLGSIVLTDPKFVESLEDL